MHGAFARAVIFAEKDALPATKHKATLLDKNVLVRASENGLGVRVGIAFGVTIRAAVGDEAIHNALEIGRDVGIGVFIDCHAGSGVRDIDVANPLLDAGFGNQGLDFGGYVNELRTAVGADA